MPDIFDKKKRSDIMSRIRGTNTQIEKIVFRELRQRRIYFQKHYKRARGCPDLALPRKKRAVFIDGDFWHGYDFDSRKLKLLDNSQYYWIEKIERNMERDKEGEAELRDNGWRILRIWEHRLRTKGSRGAALDEIADFLLAP